MSKKILVIDDEELVTESLKKLLKKSGYEVEIARNGIKALEKIKESDFDLIISDIRMPDMDGVEVIKQIREHLRLAGKAPVLEILITGYANEESMDQAQKLKVADYLYKPFNIHDFLQIVKKNLDQR